MTKTVLTNIAPQDFSAVGGFLGQRFQANRVGRLKDRILSEEFVRLHERKVHRVLGFTKTYDDWFWLGEQVGKWLDASAYAGLIADDQELLDRVHEVVERLARSQEEDGYLGVTIRHHRNPVRGMELYEMYYVLHGLLVCAELLDSQVALETARRLGDYIIRTWGPDPGRFPLAGRFPGNGHDGGEGTLILEPIVLLGQQTGDARYVEWGERTLSMWDEWMEAYPESIHTCGYTAMRQFAGGEKHVDQLRENIHAHTFHMTLLGVAALYNATGKTEYQDVVLGCVDRLADEWIFLTGGMSSAERYVSRRFYHPRNDVEVCPQHTWILLLNQALQWTGKARYAAEIERDLFNHFLAAQLADGSNWSYMTPLNGQAQEPYGPNCCNAAGVRIAGRMPTYLYGVRNGGPAVLMYTESQATLRPPGLPAVTLRQETDFPSGGMVTIHVYPEQMAEFSLHLRIPPYATGAEVRIGHGEPARPGCPDPAPSRPDPGDWDGIREIPGTGSGRDRPGLRDAARAGVPAQAGDFVVIEREWKAGDSVELSLPFQVSYQASDHMLAVARGPLVYAYFQDAQADPVVFHHRRGLYPEDAVLRIDPNQLGNGVQEEPTRNGLLGPALRVAGLVRSRAPVFASPDANSQLPGGQEQSLLLLPFVNQGAIRGEYRVFMEYARA